MRGKNVDSSVGILFNGGIEMENDLQLIRNLPADYSETVWIDKKEKRK